MVRKVVNVFAVFTRKYIDCIHYHLPQLLIYRLKSVIEFLILLMTAQDGANIQFLSTTLSRM